MLGDVIWTSGGKWTEPGWNKPLSWKVFTEAGQCKGKRRARRHSGKRRFKMFKNKLKKISFMASWGSLSFLPVAAFSDTPSTAHLFISSCTFCCYSTHNCIAQERNSFQPRTQASQSAFFCMKAWKRLAEKLLQFFLLLFFFLNKLYKPLRLVGIKSKHTWQRKQIAPYEILPEERGDLICGRTSVIFTPLMIRVAH